MVNFFASVYGLQEELSLFWGIIKVCNSETVITIKRIEPYIPWNAAS